MRKTPERREAFDTAPVHASLEATPAARGGTIVYRLVDQIAEDYLDLVDAIDDEIDELEDGVERWSPAGPRPHLAAPARPAPRPPHALTDARRGAPGRRPPDRRRRLDFADAYDKLLRAVDGLDLSRDLLAGVRDYHQSKIANDQNEVTKRLTVIASILLVPTFIVGLYGQNFHHIPELSWGFGYWWSWGWIVLTTVLQLAFFRWLGWIGGDPLGRPHLPPLQRLDPRQLRGRRRRRAPR